MKLICVFTFLFGPLTLIGQKITSSEIVRKSIAFHDPQQNWAHFQDTISLTQIHPNNKERSVKLFMDRPNNTYYYKFAKDTGLIDLILKEGRAYYWWNESDQITDEKIDTSELTLGSTNLYNNYSRYLYGLPMKILEVSAIIHPQVEKQTLHSKPVYKVKVTYSSSIEKNVWYFYFDPESFELKAYQFFEDESKNQGEYVLLLGLFTKGDIKMPKERHWFTITDNQFLGVDIILE